MSGATRPGPPRTAARRDAQRRKGPRTHCPCSAIRIRGRGLVHFDSERTRKLSDPHVESRGHRELDDLLGRKEALHRGECRVDRKSTRLNSSHLVISYAVFCLKKKKIKYDGTWKRQRERSDYSI